MNKNLKVAVGFLISAFCLWFTFHNFNSDALKESLRDAQWIWFLPALLVYMCAHWFRALRWKAVLSPLEHVKATTLFWILMFGFLLNNVLPARAGEFARAFAVNRLTSISGPSALGSIGVERLGDLFGLVLIMIIGSRTLPSNKLKLILGILIGGIAVLTAVLIISQKLKEKFENELTPTLLGRGVRLLNQIAQGFSALRSFSIVSKVLACSAAVWLIEATSTTLISRAFGLNLAFTQTAALMVGLSVGVMIPAAPGYVGTYEAGGKSILTMLGFAPSRALAFVLILHFFQIVVTSVLGIPMLFKVGMPKGTPQPKIAS